MLLFGTRKDSLNRLLALCIDFFVLRRMSVILGFLHIFSPNMTGYNLFGSSYFECIFHASHILSR